MKKQTYFHKFLAIAFCSAALLTAAAAAAQDTVIPFTVDAFGGSAAGARAGGGQQSQTCQIVIARANGKTSMVCEGVNAKGNRVSCTSDKPPFAGALLAFSSDEATLLANLGEPKARCKPLK